MKQNCFTNSIYPLDSFGFLSIQIFPCIASRFIQVPYLSNVPSPRSLSRSPDSLQKASRGVQRLSRSKDRLVKNATETCCPVLNTNSLKCPTDCPNDMVTTKTHCPHHDSQSRTHLHTFFTVRHLSRVTCTNFAGKPLLPTMGHCCIKQQWCLLVHVSERLCHLMVVCQVAIGSAFVVIWEVAVASIQAL